MNSVIIKNHNPNSGPTILVSGANFETVRLAPAAEITVSFEDGGEIKVAQAE